MSTVKPLEALIVAALDPGIRDVVQQLRAAGFETTDSGDGVSKPADWYEDGSALPFPHVWCRVDDREALLSEADRLFETLGRRWDVEATYSPKDGLCILLVSRLSLR